MMSESSELQSEALTEAEDAGCSSKEHASIGVRENGSFVVFLLDGERFALPLAQVEIALRMVSVTPVPDAPHWVIGVIDLHGRIITVADLRQRLGHPVREPHLDDRLLVMSLAERTFALIVDEVTEVLDLSGSHVDPLPADSLGNSAHLKGIIKREDGLILILDAERLFPQDAACARRDC